MADDPLARTPDMEGLSPSERAAIYKQRAAAAGIGRAPSPAAADGAAAAPAPAAAAAAPAAPARPAAPAAAPAAGAAVLERPAGAGVPAKVAAAAAARREQVAAVAKREAPAPGAAEQAERLVYVWPHLVMIEFLAAMLLLLSMVIVGVILQAPLEAHANPDRTPNPSKAPWYFLNLQELLLHMHPALAGVLIPGFVLFVAIPLIPYFDRSTADVGKWFGTPKAKKICTFTAIYTFVVEVAEIWFDAEVGVKPMMTALADLTHQPLLADLNPFGIGALSLPNVIVPMLFIIVPTIVLILLLNWLYQPDGVRDYMFALFTGFVVSYVLLTVVGSFFRGQGMHLYLPWDEHMARID
jgi:menaquinol-cytochrome c reductase cytochrome b/c subunit